MRSGAGEPAVSARIRGNRPQLGFLDLALGKPEKTRYITRSGRAGCCWHVRARIPKTRYARRSFLSGHPHGLLEGNEKPSFWRDVGRGLSVKAGRPRILSKTAGARGETPEFLQRLNRMACIDG